MKPNFTTQKIIIERKEKIAFHKKALERSQGNVQNLSEIIAQEESDLKCFERLLN